MRHHHRVVRAGEGGAVVVEGLRPNLGAPVAGREAAAVRVEHHRPPLPVACPGGPDVEEEAALARGGERPLLWPASVRRLDRLRPVDERIAHPRPGGELRRRLEAAGAFGRVGVRDALEDREPAVPHTPQSAVRRLHDDTLAVADGGRGHRRNVLPRVSRARAAPHERRRGRGAGRQQEAPAVVVELPVWCPSSRPWHPGAPVLVLGYSQRKIVGVGMSPSRVSGRSAARSGRGCSSTPWRRGRCRRRARRAARPSP